MAKEIFILSLDGGGVRGLMVAAFLRHLEREVGQPLAGCVDLIAGTSSGAVLTGGLAFGQGGQPLLGTSRLPEFFYSDGPKIFRAPRLGVFKTWRWLSGPLYSTDKLNQALKRQLGQSMLSEIANDILLTSYDMRRGEPVLFQSWLAGAGRGQTMREEGRGALEFCPTSAGGENDVLLADAITASAAVPTFFSPVHMARTNDEHYALIDGFVYAINPVLPAYFAARRRYGYDNRFRILSIGTGKSEHQYHFEDLTDRGAIRWIRPMLEAFPDGASDASVTYMDWVTEIADVEHLRVNTVIDRSADRDAPNSAFGRRFQR